VRDDPIALLERELLDAAHRRAVVLDVPDASSHEPRGPWPHVSRPARRRSSLGAFAAVVMAGLAVVVALGALVALHRHEPSSRPAPAAHHVVPGRRQLIAILGVLRRPQTKADLSRRILPTTPFPLSAMEGEPDLPLVRFATTAPWGEKLYLVPSRPPTAAELAIAARRFPQIHAQNHVHDETLAVMSAGGGGGGSDAAAIEAGSAMQIEGAGHSFAGGSTKTRFILVVPDGVTRVEFYFPPQAIPAGGPVYRHSLAVTVPVNANIAAVEVNRQFAGGEPALIWYGAAGQVIKRIPGTPQFPAPRPGPETALSRAAERNPATPNRVWATPATGRSATAFHVQFRLLLNDADYEFRGVGPSAPGCQSTFGAITGGGIDDVRGRIFSDTFSPAQGRRWCPGTYTVTVAADDRGRAGTLHGPPRPFGTATFTVIR
jgi:hypothetical protein